MEANSSNVNVHTNHSASYRINKGDSKSLKPKVEQLFFQYGLLDVVFYHLRVNNQ